VRILTYLTKYFVTDFKKGIIHPSISLVDVYQLYPHLLKITPQPNNGTWSAVSGMLLNHAGSLTQNMNIVVFMLVNVIVFVYQ